MTLNNLPFVLPLSRRTLQYFTVHEDGKTTTLAEVIFQELENQKRVLACAPSNTAVDNLLEKLIALNIRA